MAAAGRRQAFSKLLCAVGNISARAHLVIGLLVGAAHPRCAEADACSHYGYPFLGILYSLLAHEFIKMYNAVHTCGT